MKPLFDRVLELTGIFETSQLPPESYGVSVGNFDGGGMSFGILQFNLVSGALQLMLRTLLVNERLLMERCFGQLLPELEDMLANRSTQYQINWATKRTHKGGLLRPEWSAAFRSLGLTPECQAIQRAIARERYFDQALRYHREYGLWSERGLALMFDICVQNGSIQTAVRDRIMDGFLSIKETNPILVEVERMRLIANLRSEASYSRWVENVRRRKLAIANGHGIVNGIRVNLDELGLRLIKAEV